MAAKCTHIGVDPQTSQRSTEVWVFDNLSADTVTVCMTDTKAHGCDVV